MQSGMSLKHRFTKHTARGDSGCTGKAI